MLIVRAPVRISFGGGGTDLAAYAGPYGGLVLSAAISRYCYVIISQGEPDAVQINSADMQQFTSRLAPDPATGAAPLDGEAGAGEVLALPWAVVRYFHIQRGLNIFLASEVPPGTGLGSSSTLTVALIKALAALWDYPLARHDLAEIAAQIEIDYLGMPIGRQDQYASAFGGLNTLYFDPNAAGGGTRVEPVALDRATSEQLERHLLLFYTGTARHSKYILREQRLATVHNDPAVIQALHAIKALALEMRATLQQGDLAGFGGLLDQAWQHKKHLAGGITTAAIDAAYTDARRNGAWGGKITGAGGGGFLLLCCPPERQDAVTAALHRRQMYRTAFRLDRQGAAVLLNGGDIDVAGLADHGWPDLVYSLGGQREPLTREQDSRRGPGDR